MTFEIIEFAIELFLFLNIVAVVVACLLVVVMHLNSNCVYFQFDFALDKYWFNKILWYTLQANQTSQKI